MIATNEGPATLVSLPVDPCLTPVSRQNYAPWPHVRGYEILSVIGSGGMGIVYKARHRDLNRTIALKMLRRAALQDPELRERFQAEAEAVAKLQHPNIIQVFEVGTVETKHGGWQHSPFISLEFVDGGSLQSKTNSPQSPQYAARIVEKLARAAHAAHQVGVIHRDLKPANVLLTTSGEPKIADFGVAKQIANERDASGRFVTQLGTAVGTPEYMAPEQVWCDTATGAIDIYALGVILYELLTARVPFQAETSLETMELVINQEPVSPKLLQPSLPRDLETICLKCLQKTADRRYATADALADDLNRWLEHKPIHARPVGRLERTIRLIKRNPSIAALTGLVILVALTGIAGVIWGWSKAQANANEAHANAAEAETNAAAASEAARLAEERAGSERFERYRSSILAASSALQVHNVLAARRALDAAPVEHRNWEWRYIDRQLDVSHEIYRRVQTREVENFASTDGLHIGRREGTNITVWNANKRMNSSSIEGAPNDGLGPYGKLMVSLAEDQSVTLWNLERKTVQAVLRGGPGNITAINFSPNGAQLAISSNAGDARIWDCATGKLVHTLRGPDLAHGQIAFSDDGKWLAAPDWHKRTAHIWNALTGELTAILKGHLGDVTAVRFSPDSSRLLTVEDHPTYRLRLWETATSRLIAEMKGHTNRLTDISFSPDGSHIASTGMDQTIWLWDGVTGKKNFTLRGHSGWVNKARFSHDGKQLVSASHDHSIRLWDVGNGNALAVLLGHTDIVQNVAYLDDRATLVSYSDDGSIRYWNLKELERDGQLQGHTSFVYGVAMHPDNKHVASASWDGTVRVWDSRAGREVLSIPHPNKTIVTALAYHPKGHILASTGRENAVYLWNSTTGELLHEWSCPNHPFLESRLAFNPPGTLLACGGSDGCVRVLDVNTKLEVAVFKGHRDTVRDVVFSPDGRFLASGGDCVDRTIRIWDLETKAQVHVLEAQTDRVNTLTFSADGKLLASGSTDGVVRFWDITNGVQLATLKHQAKVYGLAFTPNGSRLATACADNTIRLWDVVTRQEVAELRGHTSYAHAIAFTSDGTRLVSASGDSTLRVWDTTKTAGPAK